MQLDANQLFTTVLKALNEPADYLPAWYSGYDLLVQSLNFDAQLHKAGTARMAKHIERLLINRLSINRVLQQSPDIAHIALPPLIIIAGMGRTGTTKLHRLLASTGAFNTLPLWRLLNPASEYLPETYRQLSLIEQAQAVANQHYEAAPDLAITHPLEPLEIDEESWLLELSFQSPSVRCWCDPSDYLHWVAKQDFRDCLEWLKTCLQFFHWQGWPDPSKPWLLKCPFYFGFERELLDTFPSAHLIHTQRNPEQIGESLYQLLSLLRRPYTHTPVSRNQLKAEMAILLRRHHHRRENLTSPDSLIELTFDAIQHSPMVIIERLFEILQLELSNSMITLAKAWCDDHPNPPSLVSH